MIKTATAAIVVANFALLVLTACGGSSSPEFRFRIYDASGQAKPGVTAAGVLRNSARASQTPDGSWSFYFRLTDKGEAEFHRLTRSLAKRGARLHRVQRMTVEMNGTVLARAGIDYKVQPDGFDGRTGLEFPGLRPATARRFAQQMRSG
ncbi:MAG: hypothetical protein M3P18_06315 [Actinomycetota bacterium]|nr:hypothetical protein [Actinomycetota bacterium]